MRVVIVYNHVIMCLLHEWIQLPLQLLQQKILNSNYITITEKHVIDYNQLRFLCTAATPLVPYLLVSCANDIMATG